MISKLLGSIGATQYILTGAIVLIFSMSGFGYFYYKDSQKTIGILNKNISTLEADNKAVKLRLDTQRKAIDSAIATNKDNADKFAALSSDLRSISEQSRELSQLYREHDLNNLANAKPKLIEKRINNATKDLFDELESITNYE